MKPTANMPLADYIRQHYRDGRPLSQTTAKCLRMLLVLFDEVLERVPRVHDLNKDTYQCVMGAIPERQVAKFRAVDSVFRALWNHAAKNNVIPAIEIGNAWQKERKEIKGIAWTQEVIELVGANNPREIAAALGVSRRAAYYVKYNLGLHRREPKRVARDLKAGPPRAGRPKKVRLSTEEGTLNWICQTKYFPRNARIRTDQTRDCYDKALRDFRDLLGHEPTIEDLTDENVEMLQGRFRQKSDMSPKTANERIGRIVALWNWLAKKRMVDQFPAISPLPCPQRSPVAWTQEQIAKLFDACRREPGTIAGIPAGKWWEALHAVIWDSGARIGEVLALRWEWLDFESGFVKIPAEVRKGGMKDAVYSFHESTLTLLREIELPAREVIFTWPQSKANFYLRYNRILKRAELPHGRKDKFHKIRRSVASHLQAAGVDASAVLMHSSAEVTRESYLDPTIVNKRKTHEVLFRPHGENAAPAQASVAVQPIPAPMSQAATVADVDAMAFL